MEEIYADFLVNYVSTKLTVELEPMEELNRLTHEYIEGLAKEFFTKQDLLFYLDYLEMNMNNESKHFFCLQYDKQRYIDCLIDMIKHLIAHGVWDLYKFDV